LLERSGIIAWLVARLSDPRAPEQVTYPLIPARVKRDSQGVP